MLQELMYPFDADHLNKKKKSIKKSLLADGSQRIKKKIAVLGGSTTNNIINMLELFLLNEGIEPSFYESEYDQYFEDAMFPPEELLKFKPDIVFFHTTNRNILNYPDTSDSEETVSEMLEAEMQKFTAMWENIHKTFNCPVIQNNFEMPMFRLLGNRDAYDIHGRTNYISRLNERFYEYARTHETFHIHDLNYVSADYGLKNWSDPSYWNMYKYAMCFDAIPYFAFSLSHVIKSIFGRNKKVLALDLDNTLWGGVIGDDGLDGIEIGQENGFAQSYYEFQEYVKQLKQIGIMLTVCSKNEHENALEGLNHPEGAVKPDDFILIKANWENKDRNLIETADELSLLPESFVFADDNPAERAIVSAQIPGIAVPKFDSVENYIFNIDRNGFFETTSLSADDLKRNEMYKENIKRAQQMSAFSDYSEYLKSLEMTAVIDDFVPVYLARITQLANKSNQFNLTTRRFTTDEMDAVYKSPDYIRLYGKLTDKFGDNGVVSVVIGKKEGEVLDIILWIMSCRVLKRDMELAMLDVLVFKAKKEGIRRLKGHYFPTAKNKMVKDLYSSFGFSKLSEDKEGNTLWELDITNYSKKCEVINIMDNVSELMSREC